jgi:hypothetical protein
MLEVWSLTSINSDNIDFAYTIILNPLYQHTSPSSTLHHSNRTLLISYPPHQHLALPDYLSRTILTLFASERRYIRSVLHRSTNDLESMPEFARRVVRTSPKYQVTFSLLNGGGEEAIESWDIAEALRGNSIQSPSNSVYLNPLIRTLGVVANLTVDSQVQFYAGLTFEPQKNEGADEHIVPLDKLPSFVNSAEWNLGKLSQGQINRSNRHHLLSRHKLHSLRPSSLASPTSSRACLSRLCPELFLLTSMGRSPNL